VVAREHGGRLSHADGQFHRRTTAQFVDARGRFAPGQNLLTTNNNFQANLGTSSNIPSALDANSAARREIRSANILEYGGHHL